MIGQNNTITTERRDVSPTGKESFEGTIVLNDVPAYVEQLSPDVAVTVNGEFTYLLYRATFDQVVDIKDGDAATDQEAVEYTVQSVEQFPGGEIPGHTEAYLLKNDTK